MGRLEGTVAYVTGGASGLGAAIVERFVAEGASASVLDRSAEGCDRLRERFGERVITTVGDVREYGAHERAVEACIATFGRLDTYVGNAAIWDGNVSIHDLPPERIGEAFDEVFGINVKGYLLGAKASAGPLTEARGSMIFTLSMAALHASGGGPLYTASKHAGIGLVRELAYELAPEVRVNGVAPGAMATDLRGPQSLGRNQPLMATVDPDVIRSGYPLDFFPTPEDYVGPYVFLASHTEAATVTGVVVEASLGLSARGVRKTRWKT
jgi:2,3-dihydroxy-2,3-dihydrophenylpropionate dehydrogenase